MTGAPWSSRARQRHERASHSRATPSAPPLATRSVEIEIEVEIKGEVEIEVEIEVEVEIEGRSLRPLAALSVRLIS